MTLKSNRTLLNEFHAQKATDPELPYRYKSGWLELAGVGRLSPRDFNCHVGIKGAIDT